MLPRSIGRHLWLHSASGTQRRNQDRSSFDLRRLSGSVLEGEGFPTASKRIHPAFFKSGHSQCSRFRMHGGSEKVPANRHFPQILFRIQRGALPYCIHRRKPRSQQLSMGAVRIFFFLDPTYSPFAHLLSTVIMAAGLLKTCIFLDGLV